MADGGHIYRWAGTKFDRAQLDYFGNIPDKSRKKNMKSGLGGDAITRLLQY